MKKNMGTLDMAIRLIIAVILAVLVFTGVVTGTPGIVLLVVAGVLVITILTGFCGLYTLFGINTCKVKEKKED